MTRAKKAPATDATGIPAIKGFNSDLTCRGFKYEPGKTFEHDGPVVKCGSGFHSCPVDDDTSPLSVFEYYAPAGSRYFDVVASGKTDRDGNKIASAKLTIGVEVSLHELIGRFMTWATKRAGGKLPASNSGNYGAASNSGTRGAASNSGTRGAASNSGDYGAASNSGNYGAASNSGNYGAASNSGDYGAASNSGDYGAASNSGTRGAASNSGYYGCAFNGGYGGTVKSIAGGAICAVERDGNYHILSIASGIVGQNGLEPEVAYKCVGGKLVAA